MPGQAEGSHNLHMLYKQILDPELAIAKQSSSDIDQGQVPGWPLGSGTGPGATYNAASVKNLAGTQAGYRDRYGVHIQQISPTPAPRDQSRLPRIQIGMGVGVAPLNTTQGTIGHPSRAHSTQPFDASRPNTSGAQDPFTITRSTRNDATYNIAPYSTRNPSKLQRESKRSESLESKPTVSPAATILASSCPRPSPRVPIPPRPSGFQTSGFPVLPAPSSSQPGVPRQTYISAWFSILGSAWHMYA